jgi:hypothetical protein
MLDILIFIFFLVFSILFLFIVDEFFFITLHKWLLGCLIRCVHKFFDLLLGVFLLYISVQNLVDETIWSMVAQKSLKILGVLRLLFLGGKFTF